MFELRVNGWFKTSLRVIYKLSLLLSAGLMMKFWKDRVVCEQGETGAVQSLSTVKTREFSALTVFE